MRPKGISYGYLRWPSQAPEDSTATSAVFHIARDITSQGHVDICFVHGKSINMKKLHFVKRFCFVLLILSKAGLVHGKIWRVNNQPGINADFSSVQAAHDAASAGDTLHLEGSPTGYGSLTCTKKIILLGPGYFLAENPNTMAITFSASIGSLYFNAGSQYSVVVGCVISGLYTNTSNITVQRNAVGGTDIRGDSSIYLSQNYFYNRLTSYAAISNLIISNNIIPGGLNLNSSRSVIIVNNVLSRCIYASESFFSNNIIIIDPNTGCTSIGGTSNLFSHNITNVSNLFTATNGNQVNVDMATVFLVAPNTSTPQGISTDGRWQLKAGSPAKGAAFGSTVEKPVDCGAFGGTYPYVLSGLPPIPSIYFFVHQPVGSNADPLDVQIKVISRN